MSRTEAETRGVGHSSQGKDVLWKEGWMDGRKKEREEGRKEGKNEGQMRRKHKSKNTSLPGMSTDTDTFEIEIDRGRYVVVQRIAWGGDGKRYRQSPFITKSDRGSSRTCQPKLKHKHPGCQYSLYQTSGLSQ